MGSSLPVQLALLIREFLRLLSHSLFQGLLRRKSMLRRILPNIFRNPHRAELRSTHATKMRCFRLIIRQRRIMERPRTNRIESQIKLILPSKLKPRLTQCIIPHLHTRESFCQIRRMSRNFIGNYTFFNILFIRQAQMLFWSYITKHRTAIPTNICRTNTACNMVITRRHIRC